MQKIKKRPRRCQLAVPGSSVKMLKKASSLAVDHVFLDLEDAVAPNAKVDARKMVVDALNQLDWTGKVRCVRIDDCTTEWCYGDVIEVIEGAKNNIDTLMLTKVRSVADVYFVDTLLHQLEKKLQLPPNGIGLEILIEDVAGLMNVDAIAGASERLECLIFGMGDYSASHGIDARYIGGENPYPGDIWHYARFKMTIAAQAHGLDAVDGPFPDFSNISGYKREAEYASILGMVGKWAIHPSQIEIAQKTFSPDPVEILKAQKLIEVYDIALAKGDGAVKIDGAMIDAASIRMVQQVIDKAKLYGMTND